MREYKVDSDGSSEPQIDYLGEATSGTIRQLYSEKKTDKQLRIESICRQLQRYENLEASIAHWRSVVQAQVAERDYWNSQIAESEAILAQREGELKRRSEITAALRERLELIRKSLQRDEIMSLLQQFVADSDEELPEVMRRFLETAQKGD